MSELTSSTEVDGASSVQSAAACNSPIENTPRPETIIPEHTEGDQDEGDPDSITHDYVHVSYPIYADSDELRSETNQPSLFAGYLEQCAEYLPSLQTVTNVLPTWIFPAGNDGATSASPETSIDVRSFDSWVNEAINGDYTGSIEDEQRFRTCLVRAMSENFDRLHRIENTFFTENCSVTEEEQCYARSSDSQFTRRLLLMLLNRDTQTMLTFIHRMVTCKRDAVDSILNSLHRHLEDSSFAYQAQCLRCLLRERVNISLVTDCLPQCSSDLLTFVTTVSEVDQPGRPSHSERLWNKLFEIVNNTNLYQDVIRTISRALEICGYHTDIVRMMQNDTNVERSRFVCTCEAMRTDESRRSKKVEETHGETQSLNHSTANACNIIEQENSQTDMTFKDDTQSSNRSNSETQSESSKIQIDKFAKKENTGATGCADDLQQSGIKDGKTFSGNNKRKPDERKIGNVNTKRNKKEPNLNEYQKIVYTNLKHSKRKEGPSGPAVDESKKRKEREKDIIVDLA